MMGKRGGNVVVDMEKTGMKCGMRGCWQKDRQPLALIREADTLARLGSAPRPAQ